MAFTICLFLHYWPLAILPWAWNSSNYSEWQELRLNQIYFSHNIFDQTIVNSLMSRIKPITIGPSFKSWVAFSLNFCMCLSPEPKEFTWVQEIYLWSQRFHCWKRQSLFSVMTLTSGLKLNRMTSKAEELPSIMSIRLGECFQLDFFNCGENWAQNL